MMGLCDNVSLPGGARPEQQAGRHPMKKCILPVVGSPMIKVRWSMFGMAVGYFCLVAILTVAPIWQQAIAPHQGQPLACTDFGGSR